MYCDKKETEREGREEGEGEQEGRRDRGKEGGGKSWQNFEVLVFPEPYKLVHASGWHPCLKIN